jgi:hypothetical protein
MVYFHTKNPNLGVCFGMENAGRFYCHSLYFTVIWKFYVPLEYFVVHWYISESFGMLYVEKCVIPAVLTDDSGKIWTYLQTSEAKNFSP